MEAPQTMQPQFPTERASSSGSRILSLVFLFTLSLTFSAAHALEGVVVARLDGTTSYGSCADGLWAKGNHRMAWHHENDSGEQLESGIYVVRLSIDQEPVGGLSWAR